MDSRYTDMHVRRDPSLTTLAYRYLQEYDGTFEFLTSARRLVIADMDLNTATIRGVLNCMLADGNVVNMPEPAYMPFDANDGVQSQRSRGPIFERGEGGEVRINLPQKLRKIPLRTNWRREYAVSVVRQAHLVHGIDPRSGLVKYVNALIDGQRLAEWYRWEINFYCTTTKHIHSEPDYYTRRYRFLDTVQARLLLADGTAPSLADLPARLWKVCAKCQEIGGMKLTPFERQTSTSTTCQ